MQLHRDLADSRRSAVDRYSVQGEYFTVSTLVSPATNYTGPALVVLPALDFIFAHNGTNGNALATSSANTFFPASSKASGYTPVDTGHAM